ncbi:MAG TPA: ABC transporter permease [Bryobacteraceae bacterium]|nr:ABC transporter permease [Bryobacteraceae bacterium]
MFWRSKREKELEEELRSHLNMAEQDRAARGDNPADAADSARKEFGNVGLVKEVTRDMWGWASIERFAQDLRYGLRLMARSKGFTTVAVLSLALGIGANTAIFSVIDTLMLRKLPVRDPEQLVTFNRFFMGQSDSGLFDYRLYLKFRGLPQVFSGMSGTFTTDRSNVAIDGPGGSVDPSQVHVAVVPGNYFPTLGVSAITGRVFTPDDDRVPGGHPVAVISYAYWQHRFAFAPNAVGRTLTFNGTTYTILGVTPRGFTGEWIGRPADFWIPFAMVAEVMTELPRQPSRILVRILGRLKPGVSAQQALAAAKVVFDQDLRDRAGPNPSPQELQYIKDTSIGVQSAARGISPQRETFTQPLTMLMMMVALVLLIACANIANLLLARSTGRRREMAVRLAIGAGSGRIVRQLLTESVLLAMLGGALGVAFAQWGANVLASFASAGPLRNMNARVFLDLHPDSRILVFTFALCLITGILFGLAPAFRAARVSISPALVERGVDSRGSSGLFSFGKLLVVSQVALSLLLLIGAGLFVRTLRNLKSQNLGFDTDHVLLVWLAPGQTGRWGPATAALYQTMEERLSAIPGVRAASPSVYGLLQGNTLLGAFMNVPGYVPNSQSDLRAQWSIVGPRFLDAMGLHLLEGRNITDRDTTTTPQVAVINQSMARHFFPNQDPLGKHFESWGITKEIVGVVEDMRYESPRQEGQRMFYMPYRQQLGRLTQVICVAVRAVGNPAGLSNSVRQVLREIDPKLPVLRIETVDEQLDDLLVQERLVATLAGFFGGLAVLLACLGLYGVMSYTAARRTNEIGIRLALGATRAKVLGMVLGESLLLVAVGIAIGVPVTLAAARMISTRLFGVSATDPLTITGATLLMIAVAALAGYVPARRAAHVDPMVALRYE